MVKTFALNLKSERAATDMRKQIRDRCVECFVPRCWTLKDPSDDGQFNLKGELVKGGKRERVQLRRLLFLLEYKELPPLGRQISMRCDDMLCINPAHMRVKGFEPSYRKVYNMIDREILTIGQAKEWYAEAEQ